MTILLFAGRQKLVASTASALFPKRRWLLTANFTVLQKHQNVGRRQEQNCGLLAFSKNQSALLDQSARHHSSGSNKDERLRVSCSKSGDKEGSGSRKGPQQKSDASSSSRTLPQRPGEHRGHERVEREGTHKRFEHKKRQRKSQNFQTPVISQSDYYYSYPPSGIRTKRTGANSLRTNILPSQGERAQIIALPAVDATVLLDPKKFSKASSKAAMTHGVSRSIDGADAARRVLRGKKEFVHAVRSQLLYVGNKRRGNSRSSIPAKAALLHGHGVPPQLIQHFVDMADSLLSIYGSAAECSFHNYNYNRIGTSTRSAATSMSGSPASQVQLPEVVRVRTSDSSNRLQKWPPPSTQEAWNDHMALYLTAMERIACKLALALPREHDFNIKSSRHNKDDSDDDDDFTSSTALFPSISSIKPDWNVDILRGSYFDLHQQDSSGSSGSECIHNIQSAVPIVEWVQGYHPSTLGHVLVRIQGYPMNNIAFASGTTHPDTNTSNASSTAKNNKDEIDPTDKARDKTERAEHFNRRPVTLVFDACFRTHRLRQ